MVAGGAVWLLLAVSFRTVLGRKIDLTLIETPRYCFPDLLFRSVSLSFAC